MHAKCDQNILAYVVNEHFHELLTDGRADEISQIEIIVQTQGSHNSTFLKNTF